MKSSRLEDEGCSGETEFSGSKLPRGVSSLVLDGFQCEVVELDLPCTQVLRVLQDADVKAGAGGDLPDGPKDTTRAAQSHDGLLRVARAERRVPLTLPVLVDEALVLCVGIDGRQR